MRDEISWERRDSDSSRPGESGSLRQSRTEKLVTHLIDNRFRDWYRERQYRRNIENGTPYFNGPSSVPDSERHSPSRLLECHRKVVYRQCNAPEETEDPDGIFWFGTRFEEDIALPFLQRSVTESDTYVQNSIWVDFRIEMDSCEIQIKGETDPVIVDTDAVPLLPTEIKTKSSIEHTTSPNRSHRAQLHAYMAGLTEKYDVEIRESILIYADRGSMDVKTFHVEFDDGFWNDIVLDWATNHTQYRLDDELPPAEPEQDWECDFCAYRERCGEGESEHHDVGPVGLLTGFVDYPRQKVIEYLDAHDDAEITPSLAREFPLVASEYGSLSWHCSRCESSFDWSTIHRKTGGSSKPLCPDCVTDDRLVELHIPSADKHSQKLKSTETSNYGEAK